MWSRGYGNATVISFTMDALNMEEARINQQGVILQGTMIPPSKIDYAVRIDMTTNPFTCTFLYAQGIGGVLEPVHGVGAPIREWYDVVQDNLRMCGDTEQFPAIAEERWRRTHKFANSPIAQVTGRDQLEKVRCTRCLSTITKGVFTCPVCLAVFALVRGRFVTYPDQSQNSTEQSYRIMVTGESSMIWTSPAEEEDVEPGSRPIPRQTGSGNEPGSYQQPSASRGSSSTPQAPPPGEQRPPTHPSVVNAEIAKMLDNNNPKIARMPTTTVEENEVVRYFGHYMKNNFKGKWARNFVDTKLIENGGWAIDGFLPSAWSVSKAQEQEILLTPTIVTSEVHLAAVVNLGYMTISNKSLKTLAANVHNKELSGRDLEQHCDMVISEFIESRMLALKTLYRGRKHSPLSFDMANKKW
jgi:hypothetical protein